MEPFLTIWAELLGVNDRTVQLVTDAVKVDVLYQSKQKLIYLINR